MNVNIPEGYYFSEQYDTKERFNSYWYQIHEIMSRKHGSVLQIGAGNSFLTHYLRERGVSVKDVDIASDINADITADVRDLPCKDSEYDMCVCFQVLEHLPYKDFPKALAELKRVSKKWVIISIPDVKPVYRLFAELPIIGWFKLLIPQLCVKEKKHREEDTAHFWNIGEEDYPLKKIIADIENTEMEIEKTYRVFENPFHRFFVLKKR